MGDESVFSIVSRPFDGAGSVTVIEQNVESSEAAKQSEPQEVAAPAEDRVATGDIVVEARESEAGVAAAEPEDTSTEPVDEDDEEPVALARPKKLKKKAYEKQLVERHLDWRELERKVQRDALKVVVLVEGRDAGKKGGLVNRITEFADARISRVARVEPPVGRERTQWFFQPYVAHLPAAGEIVLFDGSWYGRAALDRATGKSTDSEFAERLAAAAAFESMLSRSGIAIFKCWLSADEDGKDLAGGLETLGKRWNIDEKDFRPDVDLQQMKDRILGDRDGTPWNIVSAGDKRSVRVEAIRAIVGAFVGGSAVMADGPAERQPI